MRLERNLIEEGDYIVACRRPLLSGSGQLAVMAQGSKHVHALPMRERFDGRVGPIPPSRTVFATRQAIAQRTIYDKAECLRSRTP